MNGWWPKIARLHPPRWQPLGVLLVVLVGGWTLAVAWPMAEVDGVLISDQDRPVVTGAPGWRGSRSPEAGAARTTRVINDRPAPAPVDGHKEIADCGSKGILDCGLRIADSRGTPEFGLDRSRRGLQSAIRNPRSAIPQDSYLPLANWNAAQAEKYPERFQARQRSAARDDSRHAKASQPARKKPQTASQPFLPLANWQRAQAERETNGLVAAGAQWSPLRTASFNSTSEDAPPTGTQAAPARRPVTRPASSRRRGVTPNQDEDGQGADDAPPQRGDEEKSDVYGAHPMPTLPTEDAIPKPPEEYIIDLALVLRLALRANPTIAGARVAIEEALALQTQARAMLIPSLNAGLMLHLHRGVFQASPGQIRNIQEDSLYYGGGARALAAEAPSIPMVRIFAPLADAFFEPLSARQELATRRYNSTATANSILLDATTGYFDLVGAEGRLEAMLQSESEKLQIARTTHVYVQAGQTQQSDGDRANAELMLTHIEVQRAQQRLAVASAQLARLLNLDPAVRLKTAGGPIVTLHVVDPRLAIERLLAIALRRRPELAAQTAEIARNNTRLRQEQTRPLFPLLSLGYSAASFGGGSVNQPPLFNSFAGRQDFDLLAVWTLQNMGLGNLATVGQRRATLNQSLAERIRLVNMVRKEVLVAYGMSLAFLQRIDITNRQLLSAQDGLDHEMVRLKGQVVDHPIEVLNSVDLLAQARQDLIQAVIAYDQAQFQLYVALGQPPTRALAGVDLNR